MTRRLELTLSGKWYLALTIALGVIALVSGNNVLYLIESLLLSGLILSGILSERAISAVRIELHRLPAAAGAPSRDIVRVINQRRAPIFCVEVGEWAYGRFEAIAYLPRLGPRAECAPLSRQVFAERGVHHWDGLAVATSYPFGFARKIRIIDEPGERLVWPSLAGKREASDLAGSASRAAIAPRTPLEPADGEVRPYVPDDDSRRIVWTLSAKGSGPLVRVLRSRTGDPEVTLDLRGQPGAEFETRVREAAQPFHRQPEASPGGSLTLVTGASAKRVVHGKLRALDALAIARAAGTST